MDFIVSSKDKVRLIKKLLDENECVLVFLNTDNKDLVIPENLKQSGSVTLQISLHFQGNMFFLDNGIKVQMIFDVDYEDCFLPWNSIWGAKGEDSPDANYWLESMPRELKQKIIDVGMENGSLEPRKEDSRKEDYDEEEPSKAKKIKLNSSKKVNVISSDSKSHMKLIKEAVKETSDTKENIEENIGKNDRKDKNLDGKSVKKEKISIKSTKYPNFSIIK
ncbi:MAG: hypothetical protein SPJ04_07090 [Bdellovibrionota bacterium]|nr:hypothetical protein [Pseudomonadota bacterium]MDY6091001.1 hypothetical protein [Bdellovibrionota bacterium]